jgi:hypothetical protein
MVASERFEELVRQTPCVDEQIARRIERAYLRRRPEWRLASLDRNLWSSAAKVLLKVSANESDIPIDPELFVAAQIRAGLTSDPWMDLTRPRAGRRYVAQVRRMIENLEGELQTEIAQAEDAVLSGRSLEMVLLSTSRRMTALGRYLVAVREDRRDLALQFRDAAHEQMRICPLYNAAIADLIELEDYPADLPHASHRRSPDVSNFHLN